MHDHSGHSHGAPRTSGRRFALATGLNITLVVVQIVYGVLAHSVALLADAGHNFGDVLGLLIAWGALGLSARPPTERYTYGFRSASILAPLFNAMILLIATGVIAREAVLRFFEPAPVAGGIVMVVAAIGIAVNGLAAWLLLAGREHDLNVRGAFLHMLADAAVSAGVVLAGGAILLTGWYWIDPVVSLVISLIIVWGTWNLLRDAVNLSLDAVPRHIEPNDVRTFLERLPGVEGLHDLHIWAMSTTETAMTCHLVVPRGHPGDAFLANVAHDLQHRFGIAHATVQVELKDAGACALEPDHVV